MAIYVFNSGTKITKSGPQTLYGVMNSTSSRWGTTLPSAPDSTRPTQGYISGMYSAISDLVNDSSFKNAIGSSVVYDTQSYSSELMASDMNYIGGDTEQRVIGGVTHITSGLLTSASGVTCSCKTTAYNPCSCDGYTPPSCPCNSTCDGSCHQGSDTSCPCNTTCDGSCHQGSDTSCPCHTTCDGSCHGGCDGSCNVAANCHCNAVAYTPCNKDCPA